MTSNELATFITTWNAEAQHTAAVLRALPPDQAEFRPDPKGWKLGDLAWHLAQLDHLISHALSTGAFDFTLKPERPGTLAGMPAGYERVHAESVARIEKLGPAELARPLPSPMGGTVPVRDILWNWLLHHLIHHRGQLVLMIRLAGGTPPGLYGPTREQMEARRAKA